MTDTKTILLIGRSGRGKSTLANVVADTSEFKESGSSVSETKKIQLGEFAENNVDYQIVDTPGIGDTKMSDNEVLNIIAEAVYLARDGVGQVFFVVDGRFDQYEMATYDLLRTIIFDSEITKHTTIVRTRFADFRKPNKCEEDVNLMAKEFQEKKSELEKSLEGEEKELTATDLAEIIKSCNKVIHVDNPSLDVKNAKEAEIKMKKNKRNKSREILLKHLNENCQEKPYKPEKLTQLSQEIADDYFQYLNKKAELQKELDKEMKKLSSQSSQSSISQTSSSQIVDDNQAKLTTEEKENQTQIEQNPIIIGKEKYEKIIAQLQDKKERLKKEIAEKEKIIHQKVLKHIFNNYEAINKELGGDIFLNSVAGDYDWPELHSKFANKELVVKWLSQGFDYQQTKDWEAALIDFDPEHDADFCAWLRDKKQLTVEIVKRASYPQNIERLRNEYVVYLGKEVEILDKHKQQLEKNDWKDIHKDFYYYQKYWEEQGLTYQEAQEWISVGFEPIDYDEVKQWKNHNFTPQQVKSWIDIGLTKNEHEFAAYLRGKGHQPSPDLNLEQLREEFNTWLAKDKPAQEYLDIIYPQSQRKEITKLSISKKNLQGSLDLSDFVNLEELSCESNQLISLDLSSCSNFAKLHCYGSQIASSEFLNQLPNPEKLTILGLYNNNFQSTNLEFLRPFVNLEHLVLGNGTSEKINQSIYNRFYGSLEPLRNMSKLGILHINDTDIDSGLEYLPESVKRFNCSADGRPEAECQTIYKLLENLEGENFPQKLQAYKQKLQEQSQQQARILQPANLPFNPNK